MVSRLARDVIDWGGKNAGMAITMEQQKNQCAFRPGPSSTDCTVSDIIKLEPRGLGSAVKEQGIASRKAK